MQTQIIRKLVFLLGEVYFKTKRHISELKKGQGQLL